MRQQQRQVAVQGVRQQSRAERSAGNGGHGSHGASPRRGAAPILQILEGIHETADAPLYVRLYQHVRDAIVSGALAPGQRLPASRTLAEDLRVSRNTVESALEQLRAEGFVQRRVGAGSIVAPDLPVNPRSPQRFRSHARTSPPPDVTYDADALSGRGRQTLDSNHLITSRTGFTFAPCVPDSQVLPLNGWRQILARRSRLWSRSEMLPPERAGYRPLREAIATYVVASRGVRCDWRQVLVVGSVQQGIALVSRMLLDPGDEVWLEEPGYPGARTAFTFSGAKVVPVPVDDEGIDVRAGERLAPRARMAYVTPSHQYPLGVTLTLARRMALVDWAAHNDAWILEDDYDSEFRYVGRPLASIQGLDTHRRVIYAGTFNKVLYPSLRLAYLVLPPGLTDLIASGQDITGGTPPTFLQAAVAEFIDSGQFASHLRRTREIYRERRDALLEAAKEHLAGHVVLGPAEAGMHVTAQLRAPLRDLELSAAARDECLDLPALSRYYAGPSPKQGFLINYAGTATDRIHSGAARLARLIERAQA